MRTEEQSAPRFIETSIVFTATRHRAAWVQRESALLGAEQFPHTLGLDALNHAR